MPFLKQTFIWLFFIFAVYFGANSMQSSSTFAQGTGFVSIVLALVCLYILYKLIWGSLGRPMRMVVVIAVLLYCAGNFGLLNGGNKVNTPNMIDPSQLSPQELQTAQMEAELFGIAESEVKVPEAQNNSGNNTTAEQTNDGLLGRLKTMIYGEPEQVSMAPLNINPTDYPSTTGHPRVMSGSVLYMNGIYFKLYGIDAPDPGQSCADRYGRAYRCGRKAITWLQNWLNGREVTCHLLGDVVRGWGTGTCFVDGGNYDVAAVVANAGWAVAYTENTNVYVPYEQQAARNKRGLWEGTFYKPWDWRKMMNRKVEIKIKHTSPKTDGDDSKKFDFWGLF